VARKLFDAQQDGVALADGDGVLALASTRPEEMFGYDHGELLDHSVESLIRRPAGPHRSRRSSAGLRKDGTTFPAEISRSPVTSLPDPLPRSGATTPLGGPNGNDLCRGV
jgi:PAS domain S-box-containing protein